MSRFASTKLREIDLGDGEWVKIPTALSYGEVLPILELKTELEMSKALLTKCIKEWNMKDEDGVIPEINEENILRLDVETIKNISDALFELIKNNQDKKK